MKQKLPLIMISLLQMNLSTALSNETTNSFGLEDGRTIGYAEYGDLSGFPIFYFHGGQESRLSAAFMDSTAKSLGIRIIAPDRPGIGLSTFQENRSFMDYPEDINELADHLKIQQFSVFGLSGGAPHVLACAAALSDRILSCSIVSGASPYDYKGSTKGMWFPLKMIHLLAKKNGKGITRFLQNDKQSLEEKPEKRLKQFQKRLPKPDRELMTNDPQYGLDFIAGSIEGYKQGVDGAKQEWNLYVKDWGIDLDRIETSINLWYGTEDKMAPKHRAFFYQKALRNTHLHLIENEAHFSLIRNHIGDILKELYDQAHKYL